MNEDQLNQSMSEMRKEVAEYLLMIAADEANIPPGALTTQKASIRKNNICWSCKPAPRCNCHRCYGSSGDVVIEVSKIN